MVRVKNCRRIFLIDAKAAKPGFWLISGSFWVRVGVGVRVRLGLRPYLDPTRTISTNQRCRGHYGRRSPYLAYLGQLATWTAHRPPFSRQVCRPLILPSVSATATTILLANVTTEVTPTNHGHIHTPHGYMPTNNEQWTQKPRNKPCKHLDYAVYI